MKTFLPVSQDAEEVTPAEHMVYWIFTGMLWLDLFFFFVYMDGVVKFLCKCRSDGDASSQLGKISRTFDPFKFSEHTECVICLMEFSETEMVTALPCDVRHYFHTSCI